MNDTSGPKCSASLTSAALQSSLESKLRPRLDGRGSPLYALTWKHWDMPSGPPICALRASGRRTLGNDCGGWPTPDSSMIETADPERILERRAACKEKHQNGNGFGLNLANAAVVYPTEGWATPATRDYRSNSATEEHYAKRDAESRGKPLSEQAHRLAPQGWATPQTRDFRTGHDERAANPDRSQNLNDQACTTPGAIPRGSPAPTGKRGQLNPAFSLWLMGFPAEWENYAPQGTR